MRGVSLHERTDAERALRAWPLRPLDQLLDELALLGQRWKRGEPVRLPRVTVHLRSGRELSGWVLDVHLDRLGSRTVLLRSLGPQGVAEVDVAHVPGASVEAVVVHDLVALDRPPEHGAGAPTRDDVHRHLLAAQETLAAAVGTPLEIELALTDADDDLEPLDWLLQHATEVLAAIARRDALAAGALRGRVQTLRLAVGMQPLTAFADGVLSITTPASWNRRTDRDSLTRELEALL